MGETRVTLFVFFKRKTYIISTGVTVLFAPSLQKSHLEDFSGDSIKNVTVEKNKNFCQSKD